MRGISWKERVSDDPSGFDARQSATEPPWLPPLLRGEGPTIVSSVRIWVRAALVLSVLFFVLGLAEDFENPKAAAVRLCGLGAMAAAAGSWRRLSKVAWTPLDAAVLIWLWTELLATLFSSAPLLSLFGDSIQREGFTTSLAVAGLYLAARTGSRDGHDVVRTLDVALGAATAASVYALLQAAGVDWIPWAPRVVAGLPLAAGRPSATLGHTNLLGVIAASAAASAWVRAASPGRGRTAYALVGAICAGATLVTLSRAAWLALAAGLAAGILLLAMAGTLRHISRRALLAGAALAALVIVAMLAVGWGERLAVRAGELLHPERGSGASRIEIWRTALSAWAARPWIGWGPDTFAMVFRRYQTAAYWRYEWSMTPFHAHSIYLQTLVTRGVMGFAAAVFWAGALLRAAVVAWGRAPGERHLVAAVLAVLVTLGVAGVFGALGVAGQVTLVVVSGLLAALAAPADTGPIPRAALLAGLLVAGLAACWGVVDLAASKAEAQAQDWLDHLGDFSARAAVVAHDRALRGAHRAARLSPFDDRIARLHADALLAAADILVQPAPLLLEATEEARRAIRLVPERAANHLRLGRVLGTRAAMGDGASLAEARAALERTARMAPMDALFLGECARMDLILGDTGRALDLARRAATLYPDDGPSQAMLARALAQSGDPVAAADAFRRALAGEWHGDLAGRDDAARDLAQLGFQRP